MEDSLQICCIVRDQELKGSTIQSDLTIDNHFRLQSDFRILPSIPNSLLTFIVQAIEIGAQLLELLSGLIEPQFLGDIDVFL